MSRYICIYPNTVIISPDYVIYPNNSLVTAFYQNMTKNSISSTSVAIITSRSLMLSSFASRKSRGRSSSYRSPSWLSTNHTAIFLASLAWRCGDLSNSSQRYALDNIPASSFNLVNSITVIYVIFERWLGRCPPHWMMLEARNLIGSLSVEHTSRFVILSRLFISICR